MSTSMLHEDLIFLNYKTTNFKNLIEELSHILYKRQVFTIVLIYFQLYFKHKK